MSLVTRIQAAVGTQYQCERCRRYVRFSPAALERALMEFEGHESPIWAVFPVDRSFGSHGYVLCGDCQSREIGARRYPD